MSNFSFRSLLIFIWHHVSYYHYESDVWNLQKLLSAPWIWISSCIASALGHGSSGVPQEAKSRTAGSTVELENEVPYGSQEKSKRGSPWQCTGEWKIHHETRRSLRSMIAWCFVSEQTASLEWSAWRENKTKIKANFGFKYWVMLWKKCYASHDKGEEKERKETQKAEQRIEKETCSTENDEVKSQSKF